jgi:ABC-type sulfate transport system permease subunit
MNTNATDKIFLTTAAFGELYETTLAPLAISKAKNTGVSAYGQTILDTIGLAASELALIADSVMIPMSMTMDAITKSKKRQSCESHRNSL